MVYIHLISELCIAKTYKSRVVAEPSILEAWVIQSQKVFVTASSVLNDIPLIVSSISSYVFSHLSLQIEPLKVKVNTVKVNFPASVRWHHFMRFHVPMCIQRWNRQRRAGNALIVCVYKYVRSIYILRLCYFLILKHHRPRFYIPLLYFGLTTLSKTPGNSHPQPKAFHDCFADTQFRAIQV